MGFQLALLHLILANSKGQGQGYTHFENEYLGDGERYEENCYWNGIASHVCAFVWHIYLLPWPILKVKVKDKVKHISTVNIMEMVTITIVINISTADISKMATDRKTLLLSSNRKSRSDFRLAYLQYLDPF